MYTISREELLELIKNAPNPGAQAILLNHLSAFDGKDIDCVACVVEDEPSVEEDGEGDE